MSAPVRLNVKRQPRTVAPTKASVLVLQSTDKKCRAQANSKNIGFTHLRPCDIKRLFFESHLLCMAGASKVSMQVLGSTQTTGCASVDPLERLYSQHRQTSGFDHIHICAFLLTVRYQSPNWECEAVNGLVHKSPDSAVHGREEHCSCKD